MRDSYYTDEDLKAKICPNCGAILHPSDDQCPLCQAVVIDEEK